MKRELTITLALAAVGCIALLAGCVKKKDRFREASASTVAAWEKHDAIRKEGFDAGVRWFARQVESSNVYLFPLVITNDNVTVSNCVFIQLEASMVDIRNASDVSISKSYFNSAGGLQGISWDSPGPSTNP